MNILTFGSLNLDLVYRVEHTVRGHETIASSSQDTFLGGKGFNQSVAAVSARADDETVAATDGGQHLGFLHAGCIGADGALLRGALEERGIDTRFVHSVDQPTGHAIIQVTPAGENAIIIHGGANRTVSQQQIEAALDFCDAGDALILQNEINAIPQIIEAAAERKLRVFFNAAPCDKAVAEYPLHLLDTLCVNEIEGEMLTGSDDPPQILEALLERYPRSEVIVTIGADGALYGRSEGAVRYHAPALALKAPVVDTTAAGDTFFGYYVSLISQGRGYEQAMQTACAAASLSVTRDGALPSIPQYAAVERALG